MTRRSTPARDTPHNKNAKNNSEHRKLTANASAIMSLPPLSDAERDAILAQFANNLPRNLSSVASALNQSVVLAGTNDGFDGLRTSYVPILFCLRSEATRLVDVARSCGLSQQAAGVIAVKMERLGYVAQRAHPDDRRAKHLALTARGKKLFSSMAKACSHIDQRLGQLLGPQDLVHFKSACTRLFEMLVARAGKPARSVDHAAAVPLCLTGLGVFCEREMLRALGKAAAYGRLKMSYAQVLKHASIEGTLITDLARANDVSKQAISQIVTEVEQLGYIRRRQHPNDARSVMICLTDLGLRLIRDGLDIVEWIEAHFAQVLGARAERRFVDTVELLSQSVGAQVGVLDIGATESIDRLLHRTLVGLYRDCGDVQRLRLFDRHGSTAKLSSRALRKLGGLELAISALRHSGRSPAVIGTDDRRSKDESSTRLAQTLRRPLDAL